MDITDCLPTTLHLPTSLILYISSSKLSAPVLKKNFPLCSIFRHLFPYYITRDGWEVRKGEEREYREYWMNSLKEKNTNFWASTKFAIITSGSIDYCGKIPQNQSVDRTED